jgi:hypothetical protein
MQSVDDTAFESLRPMLRNLVQKVHGHAGQHDPSDQEIADAIGPLLYGHVVNVPGDVQRDLLRVVVNESIQTLGWFLGIARNLRIITFRNATDLCGRIVANVSTIGAPHPSRKGLLKAVRETRAKNICEDPAAQRKVRDICVRIIGYIDNQEMDRRKV